MKLLHFTNCLFCDTIGLRRFYSGSICRSKGAVIMEQFKYYAPTKILFGKNTEAEVGELCKTQGASKVLVHFGGSSAKKSGLLDRVCGALQEAGLHYVTLGGVVPNPRLSKVYEGIEICRREKVDFILAVGGGSVIDSAKAIGYGITNPGDVWDYYSGKAPQACAPIGAVLTIAAAGSEMSNASVITNEDGWLKRGLQSPYAYCKFAILNPELTCTLPPYQTASGCTDIIVHTLERYFTKPGVTSLALTDGMAEALLRNVMRNARLALQKPADYDAPRSCGQARFPIMTSPATAVRATGLPTSWSMNWAVCSILLTAQALQRSGAAGPAMCSNKTPAVSHNWQSTY